MNVNVEQRTFKNKTDMEDQMLYRFIRNKTNPRETREVLDWLDESPEHRDYLNTLDNVEFATGIWLPKLQERLEAAGRERPSVRIHRSRIVRWASAVAAVLIVGLCCGHFMFRYALSQMPDVTYISANGQSALELTDGTKVWLTPGSSLSYPPQFRGRTRNVELSGEALFEVAHDGKHPFIVHTFACSAKVLGTRFDIVADERSGDFSAALLEGRLQVSHNASDRSVVMAPNEIVRLNNGILVKERLTDTDNYRWTDGIINLRGLSFEEIVRKLEANFNVRFVIKRDRMPATNFGWGKIAVSSGIEHALEVLRYGADFEYSFDRNSGIITIE